MKLPLSFSIREGSTHNRFFKDDAVAAHVLARSGRRPRLIVAFAAANEGAALWFYAGEAGAELELEEELSRAHGGNDRGITTTLRANVSRLCLDRAALGSVRMIRACQEQHSPSGATPITYLEQPGTLELTRQVGRGRRLRMRLEPLAGTYLARDGGHAVLCSRGQVQVKITALTGAAPLTPVSPRRILQDSVEGEDEQLRALAFLTFEEKLLAGSWRFLTYFGRDTLLAARLLAPVLRPRIMECALASVLDRLGENGAVAHEEEIGDWALTRSGADETPLYDYKMVDDDFLLAPVVAHYLLDDVEGRQRAAAFLSQRRGDGELFRDALRRNLKRVMDLAGPFAEAPSPENLICLEQGQAVGNWRDSEQGLGGGRFPFDVNAVLVPAALDAAGRLLSELPGAPREAAQAQQAARAWDTAWELFEVRMEAAEATALVRDYAATLGLAHDGVLEPLTGEVRFSALALDQAGTPVPVMHTDGGMALLFGRPTPGQLRQVADLILRPFPAGLRSPAGIVVANPALAPDPTLRELFSANHYHGTVVWSWQQALLAQGLARQLQRRDLPAEVRGVLRDAEAVLWETIRSTRALRGSELWSWTVEDGAMVITPFGQRGEHLAESNAAQLWSTVYLGVRDPTA